MIVLTLYDGSNLPIFQVINIFSREESSTIGNHKNQGHCPLRLLAHLLNPSMTRSNHHNLFSQFCILQEATVSCSPNYGKLITTKNLDSWLHPNNYRRIETKICHSFSGSAKLGFFPPTRGRLRFLSVAQL